jgi:hypothetical protein
MNFYCRLLPASSPQKPTHGQKETCRAVSIAILPFLAPIALIIASVLAFRGPKFRPADTLRITEIAALGALGIALFSGSC